MKNLKKVIELFEAIPEYSELGADYATIYFWMNPKHVTRNQYRQLRKLGCFLEMTGEGFYYNV